MGATSHDIPEGQLREFRVSKRSPCPICGKPDWCLSDGLTFAICQRIDSPDRRGEAGWFHSLRAGGRESTPPPVGPAARSTRQMQNLAPRTHTRTEIGAIYYYNHENGDPLYRKLRYQKADGSKITPFERFGDGEWIGGKGCMNGVPRVLYRLPVIVHDPRAERVFIVEGEKSADLLWDFGIVATCSDSGAGSWKPEYSRIFKGRRAVILPDNDEKGRKHAEGVANCLRGFAQSIKVLQLDGLGPKEDIYDWLIQNQGAGI